MLHSNAYVHIGCIGDDCPICPKLDLPEYEAVRAHLTGGVPMPRPVCAYLGGETGEKRLCRECRGHVEVKLLACAVHGSCATVKKLDGVACCNGCLDYHPGLPVRETIIPNALLADCRDHHRFNASLFDYKGRRLLAYRAGRGGSEIYVAELDKHLMPGQSVHLPLTHSKANYGREDPRLFVHNGQLHVAYVGVTGVQGPTHCLYARLSDDLRVEQIWYPHYEQRSEWEKNWTWFSHNGDLFAIYSIRPHVILSGTGSTAEHAYRTEWLPKWAGGYIRGGACPVRVGDEYWHWFHGRVDKGGQTPFGQTSVGVYNVGVYCFEARPPFRPTRYTPKPVLWSSPKAIPSGFWCAAVFPSGAVLDGDKWLVSCGVMDSTISVYEFDLADVERAMVPT